MIMWLNSGLIEDGAARIDPTDRGLTLGDGLFETIAVRQARIKRLPAHLERFKKGCQILGLPHPTIDLEKAINAVLTANTLSDARVRLTLTRGIAVSGSDTPTHPNPTILITAVVLGGAPPPVNCITATVTRRNEYSPLARIKSLNYLDGILAQQEAKTRGANEALLLNTKGRLAEATTANLFVVKSGQLFTPPIEEGALPGIMRAAVLEAYPAIQKPLTEGDVTAAEGVFLTNSLGIRLIENLDGQPLVQSSEPLINEIKSKLGC